MMVGLRRLLLFASPRCFCAPPAVSVGNRTTLQSWQTAGERSVDPLDQHSTDSNLFVGSNPPSFDCTSLRSFQHSKLHHETCDDIAIQTSVLLASHSDLPAYCSALLHRSYSLRPNTQTTTTADQTVELPTTTSIRT